MSYGPLKNCHRCKVPLNLSDPSNEGYCGGDFCFGDPVPKELSILTNRKQRYGLNRGQRDGLNRKERRVAAKRARKKLIRDQKEAGRGSAER